MEHGKTLIEELCAIAEVAMGRPDLKTAERLRLRDHIQSARFAIEDNGETATDLLQLERNLEASHVVS